MKKVPFILVLALSVLTTIHTNANNPFADEPKLHSFLAPPYNDGRFNKDIAGFKVQLKAYAKGQKSVFQDAEKGRLETHFRAMLKDNFPAGVDEVIDSMIFVPAPPTLASSVDIATLPEDFKGKLWWYKRGPYAGEMIGVYKGIPLISADCGNYVRLDLSFVQPPPIPPAISPTKRDTVIVGKGSDGNVYVTVNNTMGNNTNTNTVTTPSVPIGTMGASNVSFAPQSSGQQFQNTGNQGYASNNSQPAKQQIEYTYKPHWTEGVRNVGLGLGVLGFGIASVKNAFDPEPIDININGGWGVQSSGGWGGGYNYTNLNPYYMQQTPTNNVNYGQYNTSTLNPQIAGNYGSNVIRW